MQNITFQKPPDFAPHFKADVIKQPEIWPWYTFISLSVFFLLSGLLIKALVLILCGLALLPIFLFVLRSIKRFRINPTILEVSRNGIWFPHFKLYIPWENIVSVGENTETAYSPTLGNITIRALAIFFEIPVGQLSQLRKRVIWPTVVGRDEQDSSLIIRQNIPFTVGNGRALNISKEALLQKLESCRTRLEKPT